MRQLVPDFENDKTGMLTTINLLVDKVSSVLEKGSSILEDEEEDSSKLKSKNKERKTSLTPAQQPSTKKIKLNTGTSYQSSPDIKAPSTPVTSAPSSFVFYFSFIDYYS